MEAARWPRRPWAHARHDTAPTVSLHQPCVQAEQFVAPDVALFLPAGHARQPSAPLLLDAATHKLAAQHVPVFFFCALDYSDNSKVTDDVLDVIFRSEF